GRLRGPQQRGDLDRGRGPRHSHRRAGAGVREVPPHGGVDRPGQGLGAGPGHLQGLRRGHVRAHRRRQPDPRGQGHPRADQPAQGPGDAGDVPVSQRLRILVVDDEPQIHRFLSPALDAAGFEPVRAETGREALAEIARRPPDAVVLDLGLPDMDGQAVLGKARAFYAGPIIILSARDRELEKIEALDAGADDYVEKPFGVGELLARLRVVVRRQRPHEEPPKVIKTGDLVIDLPRRLVTRAGEAVRLSPKEYDLLARLAEADG